MFRCRPRSNIKLKPYRFIGGTPPYTSTHSLYFLPLERVQLSRHFGVLGPVCVGAILWQRGWNFVVYSQITVNNSTYKLTDSIVRGRDVSSIPQCNHRKTWATLRTSHKEETSSPTCRAVIRWSICRMWTQPTATWRSPQNKAMRFVWILSMHVYVWYIEYLEYVGYILFIIFEVEWLVQSLWRAACVMIIVIVT